MPRHPIELAKKHYEELPVVLKQALFSAEIAEQMFEIGKKFGLTIEKTGIMAEETGYIMLGLTRPNELVGNLARELGVDSDKAQDIGAQISHQIFFPLREELKRTHDFDMGADSPRWSYGETGEAVGSGGPPERLASSSRAGMPMPARTTGIVQSGGPLGIKKTLVEEKSPLVLDLTRAKESPVLPIPQKTSTVVIPAKPVLDHDRGAGIQEAEQKTGFPITSGMTETSQLKPAPTSSPSFQPPASPTGRIDDLRKMVEKPSLPRPAPELFASPSRKITDLKTMLGKKESGIEAWEKDMEKEVSFLLKPLPIDLRPHSPRSSSGEAGQKSTVPPPSMQTKLPPIDLRQPATSAPQPQLTTVIPAKAGIQETKDTGFPIRSGMTEMRQLNQTRPSVPRMTPQLQDLTRPAQLNATPTLLEENIKKAELKEKAATPKSMPITAPVSPLSATINTAAIGDPYREPVDEDQP